MDSGIFLWMGAEANVGVPYQAGIPIVWNVHLPRDDGHKLSSGAQMWGKGARVRLESCQQPSKSESLFWLDMSRWDLQ